MLRPISWTEPAPGLFRAVNYCIEFGKDGWSVHRLWKLQWLSLGTDKTLKEAMSTCARHRRTNRRPPGKTGATK